VALWTGINSWKLCFQRCFSGVARGDRAPLDPPKKMPHLSWGIFFGGLTAWASNPRRIRHWRMSWSSAKWELTQKFTSSKLKRRSDRFANRRRGKAMPHWQNIFSFLCLADEYSFSYL